MSRIIPSQKVKSNYFLPSIRIAVNTPFDIIPSALLMPPPSHPHSPLCGHFFLSFRCRTLTWKGCFKGCVNFFLPPETHRLPVLPAFPFCARPPPALPHLLLSPALCLCSWLLECSQILCFLHLILNHPKSPLFRPCCSTLLFLTIVFHFPSYLCLVLSL